MKYLFITQYIILITVFGLQAQIPHSIEKINFDYEIDSALNFVIDNDGFFYIYNRRESSIIKFDSNGKFIKKIGSRGRGPSELLDVSLLLYDKYTDLLYAYDTPTFSVKEISTDGEFLNQYDYPDKQMINPFYGYIENGLAYLVFYGPYAISQNIVHITDIKNSKTLKSYYDYDYMTNNKNAIFKHNYIGSPYSLHSTQFENGDILLAASTYEGFFYIKNSLEEIKTVKIPQNDDRNSLKEVSKPDPEKKYRMIDGPETEIYRYVVGVAEIDSTILVFEQSNFDKLAFGYHIFNSSDYKYLGFHPLDEINIGYMKDYKYIHAFARIYLMQAENKNLYFMSKETSNLSLIKISF